MLKYKSPDVIKIHVAGVNWKYKTLIMVKYSNAEENNYSRKILYVGDQVRRKLPNGAINLYIRESNNESELTNCEQLFDLLKEQINSGVDMVMSKGGKIRMSELSKFHEEFNSDFYSIYISPGQIDSFDNQLLQVLSDIKFP